MAKQVLCEVQSSSVKCHEGIDRSKIIHNKTIVTRRNNLKVDVWLNVKGIFVVYKNLMVGLEI